MMEELGELVIFELIKFPDLIGLVGTVIALVTYVLLQTKRISSHYFLFSFLNAFSSFLILVSLMYSWNLAAFVMESAWMVTSIFGVYRARRQEGV